MEYITELYEDHGEQISKFEVTSGASIMKEDIQKALKSMKDGKATGPDELLAEALKALDEHSIEIITSLCNIIYNSGMIPTEMKHPVFITLPKKTSHWYFILVLHIGTSYWSFILVLYIGTSYWYFIFENNDIDAVLQARLRTDCSSSPWVSLVRYLPLLT